MYKLFRKVPCLGWTLFLFACFMLLGKLLHVEHVPTLYETVTDTMCKVHEEKFADWTAQLDHYINSAAYQGLIVVHHTFTKVDETNPKYWVLNQLILRHY